MENPYPSDLVKGDQEKVRDEAELMFALPHVAEK